MPTVARPNTPTAGQVISAANTVANLDVLYNLVNGALDTDNLDPNANIADTQLAQISTAGKVDGAALTGLASIPAGAGVIPAANLPSTSITPHFRDGLYCSQASVATITVSPGTLEINSTAVAKTSATTLTISTASDWAGGSSLRATSDYGYIGISAAGAVKMHTTAPTHDNYGVSTTAGTKRYATWSGTVYRIIGWFYMNATGSGELDTYGVSNLGSDGQPNAIQKIDTTPNTINDTTYGSDLTGTQLKVYTTGRPILIQAVFETDSANYMDNNARVILNIDSSDVSESEQWLCQVLTATNGASFMYLKPDLAAGEHTFEFRMKVDASNDEVTKKRVIVIEL